MKPLRIFVGYDSRQAQQYDACVRSLIAYASVPVLVQPISGPMLRALGLYRRIEKEIIQENGVRHLWDCASAAPMSTEFATARFFVPTLAGQTGWALFCDGDFMWRQDVAHLFDLADDRFAVMVVKHRHEPAETTKMDSRVQTAYPKKNWSSLMLFNLAHPAWAGLTDNDLNNLPGRALHAFYWLDEADIGDLPPRWNWLVGVSEPCDNVAAAHYTLGAPNLPGMESAPLADEWRSHARGAA